MTVSKKSSVTPKERDVDEDSLKPGTIVLTKSHSYPWWPGMVFPEALVPHIKKDKPKKKQVWPVKFFSDNHFCWAAAKEIKILSVEDARQGLQELVEPKAKQKKSLTKSLRAAYQVAIDAPTFSEVYVQTFGQPPPPGYGDSDDEELNDMNSRVMRHLKEKKSGQKSPVASNEQVESTISSPASSRTSSLSLPNKPKGISKKKRIVIVRRGLSQSAPLIPTEEQCKLELDSRRHTAITAVKTISSKIRASELSDRDIEACQTQMDLLMVIPDMDPNILQQAKLMKTMENIKLAGAHNKVVHETGLDHKASLLLKLWNSIPGKDTVM